MTDPVDAHRAACAAIARRHDRERYLVSLFAPVHTRDDLFALLAANHEIAKTAEVVSEPTIGLIRLQWWREAFEGIEAGSPRVHEVILPLAEAARRHPGVLDHLRRVVDAREADLSGEPPRDLDALAAYAGETGGEMVAAMACVLDADTSVARNLGTAWALIGLVRAMPLLIAGGRASIPASLLQENGLTYSKLRDHAGALPLGNLCGPIVERGREALALATSGPGLRNRHARALRLLAARAEDLATQLQRHGGDPAAAGIAAAPPGLVWRHAFRVALWRLGGSLPGTTTTPTPSS